jgi:SAM-dependent methyltransferase
MSFRDHFSAVATRYAAFRPRYPAALVDALAARAGGLDLAWDVGCGSGQLSVALAGVFRRVIATDPAQALLEAAEAHPRVEYRCEPAEASVLASATADLVVAAQAAPWFDFPRFLAEAGRVARPGALVALVSYGDAIVDGAAGAALAHYHHVVAGPYWPKGREHVENGYRDLVLPWPPVEAPPFAMTAAWTRDQLVGYVSSWSATRRLVEAQGPAPYEALRDALIAAWPDDESRAVRWPLTVKLARR